MSDTRRDYLTRRPVLLGLGAIGVAAIAGITADLVGPKHRRATGPYADLINLTGYPAAAEIVGKDLAATMRTGKGVSNDKLAQELRTTIARSTLPAVMAADVASNTLLEASGWLMPQTLAEICYLAAPQ
ncbi:MAG TPA: hypothetical protein VHL34_22010 [Rhizomicrobium sp.]|jgi:hypothetical protein|nr:hypothetical protein [Rhizomicrobium sp.]